MQYLYGWSWNSSLRQPIDELTEAQARTRFDEGPQLGVSALPEDAGIPLYTLTMNAHAQDVTVTRYDENGSVVATMDYTVTDGRLFLEEASEWLYPDDGEHHGMSAALAHRTFVFRPDGTAKLRSRVKAAEAGTIEQFSDVDVSDHWIEPLTWGDWDRVGLYQPKPPPQA